MYHEKQIKELCALHALNNLFQDSSAFSKKCLDNICNALSPDNWINPHKSLLGTGNYDINVIIAALTTKGCGVIWFDKRKDPGIIILDQIVGFILNVPSEYRIGPLPLPFHRKHWISIRSLQGLFYNFDSKLEAPEVIGKGTEVTDYIRGELKSNEKELLVVVTQEVERDRTWCYDTPTSSLNICQDLEAFSSPGLKFIDQDLSSSQEGNLSVIESNNVLDALNT